MDNSVRVIRSNKGGVKVALDGYMYVKVFSSESKIYWKCMKRNHCKASLVTDLDYRNPIKRTPHSQDCLSDGNKVCAIVVRNKAKQLAKDCREKPSRLFARSLSMLPDGARLSLGNEAAFARTIQRARSESFPPIPASLNELSVEAAWSRTFAQTPAEFLRFDNKGDEGRSGRILLFASDTGLNLLSSARSWFMDGNFKMAPTGFLQLYVIRVPLGSTAVSVVFCLLEKKSKATYITLFNAIKRLFEERQLVFSVDKIHADFEMVVIKGLLVTIGVLRQIIIIGCFYHLSQAVLRKIQELGLITTYKENEDHRLFCGMILALAFLPEHEVPTGMIFLEENCPEELFPLLAYFKTTYVTGVGEPRRPPLFPPEIWNVHLATLNGEPRTNNQCEVSMVVCTGSLIMMVKK